MFSKVGILLCGLLGAGFPLLVNGVAQSDFLTSSLIKRSTDFLQPQSLPHHHQLQYDFHASSESGLRAGTQFHHQHGGRYTPKPTSDIELRLIFTNDIHSHEMPFNPVGAHCSYTDVQREECRGGAARRKYIFDLLERGHPNVLKFDSGDIFQGDPFYNYYRGNASIPIMQILGYTAVTIGNHEFDDKVDHLVKFYKQLKIPVVCTNLNLAGEPELYRIVKRSLILEQYNIAILGITTVNTQSISQGTGQVEFIDPVPAVQAEIDRLRGQGITTIFVLSHCGYKTEQRLIRKTRGITLIFGGHSHSYLSNDPDDPSARGAFPTTVYDLDGRPAYVVQAKMWGEYVGFLDLTLNPELGQITWLSGQPIHLSSNVPEDAAMKAFVEHLNKPIQAAGGSVLAHVPLDMPQAPCKRGECQLANWVTNAMLAATRHLSTQIALINSDGMRQGLRQGPLTLSNLLAVFPFRDPVVQAYMTGRHILDSITGSVRERSPVDQVWVTCFAQFAGLKMDFNFERKYLHRLYVRAGPSDPPSSSDSPYPGWIPIQEDKVYSVVTLEYVAKGNDHVVVPKLTKYQHITDIVQLLYSQLEGSELNPQLDGRMVTVDPPE